MNPLLPLLLKPFRILFFLFAGSALLVTVVLFNTIENTALTKNHCSLTQTDIKRAIQLLNNSKTKTKQIISLNEQDLNLALNYLLNYYTQSTSQVTVNSDHLDFKITLLLPENLFGNYINFNFKLSKRKGYPMIYSLLIGKLQVADELAGILIEKIIKRTPLIEYYIPLSQHVKDIYIAENNLTISYITPSDLELKKKLSLSNKNYQSFLFYQQHITHIIARHDPKWRLSLAELLQPLFKQAYHRSTLSNAISENRNLLIAISTYVNKSEIEAIIPFNISPDTAHQYPASLFRRTDMAKHFMASAVLAASGATTLAYLLGEEKELNDAKKGSGFSFIDLAGDRAGLKLGQRAVASPSKARELQKIMSSIKSYKVFMPEVRDLPENMNHQKFKTEYGSIYSIKYQEMLKKIDERIANLAIYNK